MENDGKKLKENNIREWETLPANVLDIILENLISLFDYIRFGVVCKPWLFVAEHHKQIRINNYCFSKHLPLLLVPAEDGREQWRSLYNAATRKVYDFKLHVPINKRCCGSSHGWLFFVEKDRSITLFNPFTQAFIHLPTFDRQFKELHAKYKLNMKIRPFDVFKLILSVDPTLHPNDFTVVIINSSKLQIEYFKFKDQRWEKIVYGHGAYCVDIICYKKLIYAVNFLRKSFTYSTEVVCFSGDSPQFKVVLPADKFQTVRKGLESFELQNYLVESSQGSLMIIQRFKKNDDEIECTFQTTNFKVFKLVQLVDDELEVVEVKSLDGDAMFLGDNHSTSILASEYSGCEPNYIYFTEHHSDISYSDYYECGFRGIGTFSVSDGSFGSHHVPNIAHKYLLQPIWIHPKLM
ncbi:F-box protein At2g26160-like [Mercurialis annua]|uniref:F-box protein At2g26160-like n=1 Tax=Mercurialis annua TaxID=3986 RepID=UPI00215E3B0E|nr:F-box protein At2g26160-like [Mercurialis annua]